MSLPTRKLLSAIVVLAGVAAATGALAGCGGSDEEDARAVIDDAFSTDIQSAVMTLNTEVAVEGSEELSEPVNVQLTGPFQSNGPEKLPSFDFDVSLQGPGAEAVPPFGLISTGDNVFIELQGTSYEVGEEIVAQQNEQLAAQSGEEQSLAALGIDPQEWVVEPVVEGDEEVAGVETTHVTAAIDVPALVTDINGALQQASELGATTTTTPELTEEQLAQIEEAVEDPRFEVFVGKDDGALRRLITTLTFTLPEEAQLSAGGATGGNVSFDLEFAEVGEEQEIAAPPDAQPLADLATQFGGLGGLFGGSTLPGGGITPAPDTGTAPPSGTAPDQQALEEFGRCIEQADPGDAAAIQQCNELVAP